MGNLRGVPGNHRPSPGLLLLAFVLVCAAPLGVAVATGLQDGKAPSDQVQTAAATEAVTTPPPTGTADVPPSTAAATTTTSTPATSAPPDTTAPPTTPAPTTPPQLSPVDQVLMLVNDARARAATPCGPVQLDPRLMAAAQAHSDDMAARNFFDHTNPDGATFSQRVLAAGYPDVAMAENIAKGQRSASLVMRAWMESTGHRENIENCAYNFIGIGVNRSAWTWTQDFAA